MKRRIGIKRRLMAQRLINKRRSVRKDIEGAQHDLADLAAPIKSVCLVSAPTPQMLSVSLAG
jgi:hypothetical protein